ncbi:PH domain leucine-rich repeat protein phosphatase 1-like [Sinocyclocheilus grahami]|uniref:PH domain leucine-rich repeat protein phosphatase 1-like n=1 Tax=Sinocyclocheilus grahami TaxID=75366 RepID=UPI0007AD255D|nr:PREDICTED: PH domain leucine-rich repeat protein phosphatase 1-like [Sinocyclocheilus grahami]
MESVKLKKSSALSVALRSTADHKDEEEDDEGQRASTPPQTRSQSPAELSKACRSSSSLLLRKRRVKRHVSSISSSHSRSQTLLRHRASPQLQLSDRQWVRQDLRRGSVHVHDRLLVRSQPARPVLCTVESSAAEIAQRLQQASGKSGSVLRLNAKSYPSNGNCDGEYPLRHLHTGAESLPDQPNDRLRLLLLEKDHQYQQQEYHIYTPSKVDRGSPQDEDSVKRSAGSDVESSSACDDLSSGARFSQHRDSLSDDMILGTEASAFDSSAAEGLDTYGSSSDELELDCATGPILPDPETNEAETPAAGSSPHGAVTDSDSSPALYVQLHGEAARRLGPDERPLQIQNDFLFKLGFKDPWRVQEEGMNTELGSLLRFYAGKRQRLCVRVVRQVFTSAPVHEELAVS